ncbi:MAG: sugar phosphate isomerase/epimerase, partial [Chloroflexi bacterium]
MLAFTQQVPFRVGTTSYIVPDDILPNVHYLAGKVRDIELVLFELDDGPSNLPDAGMIEELNQVARANDLTYTVHLPLDLRLGAGGEEQHVSLVKARRVIEATRALDPWAYVLHLDGK